MKILNDDNDKTLIMFSKHHCQRSQVAMHVSLSESQVLFGTRFFLFFFFSDVCMLYFFSFSLCLVFFFILIFNFLFLFFYFYNFVVFSVFRISFWCNIFSYFPLILPFSSCFSHFSPFVFLYFVFFASFHKFIYRSLTK